MNWHLLNQLFVSLESKSYQICVLEEVLSSELQLVQLLVSGTISQETMMLLGRGLPWNNQELGKDHL